MQNTAASPSLSSPKPAPKAVRPISDPNRLGLHILFIVIISLLLLIPQLFVSLLLADRQSNEYIAVSSITEAWGGEQTVLPVQLSLNASVLSHTVHNPQTGESTEELHSTELFIRAKSAETKIELATEKRQRGIYEAVLYRSYVTEEAFFDLSTAIEEIAESGTYQSLQLAPAKLTVYISDPHGIEKVSSFTVNGIKLEAQPEDQRGFFAVVPPEIMHSDSLEVSLSFTLKGSEHLSVVPAARNHFLNVEGSGVIPSFQGTFLPDERKLDEKAASFAASYHQSFLSTGIPRFGSELSDFDTKISLELHGQSEHYTLIDRLIKYVLLVIALTYVTVLTFEIVDKSTVALVQYVVIGAAIVLFYLLLLSLSEHLSFTLAYIIAAITMSLMIGLYLKGVLQSFKKALSVAIMLLAVYALLFAIVHFETYALLVGTLLLTVMLGVIMFITRRLNRPF